MHQAGSSPLNRALLSWQGRVAVCEGRVTRDLHRGVTASPRGSRAALCIGSRARKGSGSTSSAGQSRAGTEEPEPANCAQPSVQFPGWIWAGMRSNLQLVQRCRKEEQVGCTSILGMSQKKCKILSDPTQIFRFFQGVFFIFLALFPAYNSSVFEQWFPPPVSLLPSPEQRNSGWDLI